MAVHPKVINRMMHPARKTILMRFSLNAKDLTFNENILIGAINKKERMAINRRFGQTEKLKEFSTL